MPPAVTAARVVRGGFWIGDAGLGGAGGDALTVAGNPLSPEGGTAQGGDGGIGGDAGLFGFGGQGGTGGAGGVGNSNVLGDGSGGDGADWWPWWSLRQRG